MRSLLFSLSLIALHSNAVIIPFNVHHTKSSFTRRSQLDVGNFGNAQYVANVSIAGNQIPVLLDTGSSDLWVYFDKPPKDPSSITDTGKGVSLSYAVGTASGNAKRTRVEFGGFTVDDQALLLVEDADSFAGDIRSQGFQGLVGLGPNSGSVIRKKLKKNNADSLMQNIFTRNKLSGNYISILINRKNKNDDTESLKGVMTIAETAPGFSNITSMPKLDVETVTRLLKSDQHWQALTDKGDGIIGPDGKPIYIESIVPRAPDDQLVAVIDTGFTFSQVPRELADAIYGRVKGAVYDTSNEWWLIPCGQYLNISFKFGGQLYPVHPLDTVDDNFSKIDASGKKVCIGSFQPITSAFSMLGHYDMILGMNFLRSAYSLYNFGNWVGGSEHPYIQMLPLTTVAAARAEFVEARLQGTDTISDSRWALLPADQMQHSPVSAAEKRRKYQEWILSRWPYIFVGCLAGVLLMIGFCVWRCCCRRDRRGKRRWDQSGLKRNLTKRGLIKEDKSRNWEKGLDLRDDNTANKNTPGVANTESYLDLERKSTNASASLYAHQPNSNANLLANASTQDLGGVPALGYNYEEKHGVQRDSHSSYGAPPGSPHAAGYQHQYQHQPASPSPSYSTPAYPQQTYNAPTQGYAQQQGQYGHPYSYGYAQ